MAIPLSYTRFLPRRDMSKSLGDHLAENVTDSGRVATLLDCLPTTNSYAFFSEDSRRTPLTHADLHTFVSEFFLPSGSRVPLGPNDRVLIALPVSPMNAVALIALASYYTAAPVNANCTAAELREDAERLGAKAVVTTREEEERLGLQELQNYLQCTVVYLEARATGPCGLFDMSLLECVSEQTTLNKTLLDGPLKQPHARPHGLQDQSLILHTSGTSGKKKVVPYSLRSLIVGTCAVIISWDLRPEDVNSAFQRFSRYTEFYI